MTWADANGFLSFVLNMAGNLFLAWKWPSGWVVRMIANVSWAIYGVQLHAWPIWANAAAFGVMNIYGWWKWRRERT